MGSLLIEDTTLVCGLTSLVCIWHPLCERARDHKIFSHFTTNFGFWCLL